MTTQSKKYVYCFDFVAYGDRGQVLANGNTTYTFPHLLTSKTLDWTRKDILKKLKSNGAPRGCSISFLNIILLAD